MKFLSELRLMRFDIKYHKQPIKNVIVKAININLKTLKTLTITKFSIRRWALLLVKKILFIHLKHAPENILFEEKDVIFLSIHFVYF